MPLWTGKLRTLGFLYAAATMSRSIASGGPRPMRASECLASGETPNDNPRLKNGDKVRYRHVRRAIAVSI
jgi:hypothetical protein